LGSASIDFRPHKSDLVQQRTREATENRQSLHDLAGQNHPPQSRLQFIQHANMPQQDHEVSQWFAAEVHVHKEALRAWLCARFPDALDPDNIVQEALTRVWQAGVEGPVPSPKALLFTIARNLMLDQYRRRQVLSFESITESTSPFVFDIHETGPSPAEATTRNQELELLTKALQSLPQRCRQVLTLRKIYGLSQKEIAHQLDISEHTVEAQIANGMRRCAEFLARFDLP
jgi:RNA polymerase sigma factor (sigma-70 family)